jgi:hypothetical protein
VFGVLKICDKLDAAKEMVVQVVRGRKYEMAYRATPTLTSSFWLGSIRAKTRTQFICGQIRLSASTTAAMVWN